MKISKDYHTTALLVIDVQQGLFRKSTPIYRAEELLDNINTLVDKAHAANVPVVYVQHSDKLALKKGSDDWRLHPQMQPLKTDDLVHKQHGNAFEETNLGAILDAKGVGRLVVTGLVTHGCVRATCLGAKKLGYHVTLVSDAHSNYSGDAAQLIEEWNQKLQAQGVELKSVANIAFN
jgi:nicotinamidase-related amidase